MIYLTTGTPGSFKTFSTLMYVEDFRKKELEQGRERNVYFYGINELTLESWLPFDHPQTWFDLPDNSIIVIDECQKVEAGFGAMSHLKQQPPCITELETHRHRGFDIFLITQGPHLINSRIKPLVNMHRHLRRINGWNKARIYENDGVIANPENKNNLKELQNKWFKPDKKFYGVYKSATMHTVKKRFPKVFLLGFLVLGLLIYSLYKSYFMLSSKMGASSTQIESVPMLPDKTYQSRPVSQDTDSVSDFNPIIAYRPRVRNMPETAPAYDELRKAKTHPKPNCVMNDDKCLCYTQQATLMYDYPELLCRSYVKNGRFDPTREDVRSERADDMERSDSHRTHANARQSSVKRQYAHISNNNKSMTLDNYEQIQGAYDFSSMPRQN